jgi:ATP-dependent protease ClpP protease subunit
MAVVQHIYCSAIISKKMCDALTSYIFSVSAAKGEIEEFVVYLVTGGGNPSSGMELYSFFKARPERTTIYNMSSVDSAGVLFFLGFQRRFGVPASSFMVHQTKFSKAMLPEWYSYSDLKKSELELLAVDQKTHRVIAAETAPKAEIALSVEDVRPPRRGPPSTLRGA